MVVAFIRIIALLMCVTATLVDATFVRVTPSVGRTLLNSAQIHWNVIKLGQKYRDVSSACTQALRKC